jgi:hypothetical protein
MKSWAILGFDRPTELALSIIFGDKGCNFKLNDLFSDVWSMIKCDHHSIHLHPIYSHYPSWGSFIGGIWILQAHKV